MFLFLFITTPPFSLIKWNMNLVYLFIPWYLSYSSAFFYKRGPIPTGTDQKLDLGVAPQFKWFVLNNTISIWKSMCGNMCLFTVDFPVCDMIWWRFNCSTVIWFDFCETVGRWFPDLCLLWSVFHQYASEEAELLLVGNKLDCETDRIISRQQGERVGSTAKSFTVLLLHRTFRFYLSAAKG